MTLPDGFVDPGDPEEVTAVLAAVWATGGFEAVAGLLGRLPGATVAEAQERRVFSAAKPAVISLGATHRVVCGEVPQYQHVVGGVVLAHTDLTASVVPGLLGRVVVQVVAETGAVLDAAAVLSAAREVADRS